MKKKILAAALAAASVLSLAGCKEDPATSGSGNGGSASSDGTKFRVACWNYEFAEYFNAFYADKVPGNIEIEWVQFANDGTNYQDNLDRLLKDNESASPDEKIDMFLAEADYIKKYVDGEYSLDVKSIGVTNTSNAYQYVLDAATTESGVLKGVSFQACPGGVIVRKSIAADVFDMDVNAITADDIQSKISNWSDFNAVAKTAKDKGYYMTPSYLETYRAFANNATTSYLNDNKFAPTQAFNDWFSQAKDFVANGYTLTCGLWEQEKTNQMMKDGKAMCFFGPSWYYNFSMSTAQAECPGDWLVVQGPQAYFWGGTWMLAAKGTDNADLVADVMDAFMNDEEMLNKLVNGTGIKAFSTDGVVTADEKYNPAFVNNKSVIAKFASDTSYKNTFLGGQNDIAVMTKIADGVVWDKALHTAYDKTFNETLPEKMGESLKPDSGVNEETAWNNFYSELAKIDPSITH